MDREGMRKAEAITKKNMDSPDGRASNGAVRNWLAMNAHNMKMDDADWEAAHGKDSSTPSTILNAQINLIEDRKRWQRIVEEEVEERVQKRLAIANGDGQ
jgi:hypothetical protein